MVLLQGGNGWAHLPTNDGQHKKEGGGGGGGGGGG